MDPHRAPEPDMTEAEALAMREAAMNETAFSSLQAQYDDTCRDVNHLEQALACARTRERVLGGAIGILHEPQQAAVSGAAAPSLR